MKQLDVVRDLLHMKTVMLRLKIKHSGGSKLRNIHLKACGLLEVADADLKVTLSYGMKPAGVPEKSTPKNLDLDIDCTYIPLTLGDIHDCFFNDTLVVFHTFHTAVKEVGLTRFKFRAGSDVAEKYVVILIQVELGAISSTIEVLGEKKVGIRPSPIVILMTVQTVLLLFILQSHSRLYCRSTRCEVSEIVVRVEC